MEACRVLPGGVPLHIDVPHFDGDVPIVLDPYAEQVLPRRVVERDVLHCEALHDPVYRGVHLPVVAVRHHTRRALGDRPDRPPYGEDYRGEDDARQDGGEPPILPINSR